MTTPFTFDAGNLALDLLNTDGRFGRGGGDGLPSPAAVLSWLAGAGVLPERQRNRLRASPPDARLLLTEAHRLRDEVHAAVGAIMEGKPVAEGTLTSLNRLLGTRAKILRLEWTGDHLELLEETSTRSAMAALAPVAEAAAQLVLARDARRIRQCHAGDCRSWFLDTSRNGRRKWCSMARCGNRAKVAAHYLRRQGGHDQDAEAL